jgi:hypothetical protein
VILTDAQVLVLLELANSGPLRPTILNHSTLSALVRRKLAERDDTPNGRFYAITPAGWDELREGAGAPPERTPRKPRPDLSAEERTLSLPLEIDP